MDVKNRGVINKQSLEQVAAYLVTGIILSISHHFHNYPAVIFFGHLLIAISFLQLIFKSFKYNWIRRFSDPLDIFKGSTLVVSFAFDVVILIVDELTYYSDSKIMPPNLLNSLFVSITIATFLWVLLLIFPLMARALNMKLSFKMRVPSFIFIIGMLIYVADFYIKIFPPQVVLSGILVLIIIILVVQQRDALPKLKRVLIYFSHLLLALTIAFILGGILSIFTKAAPTKWFWISAIISIISFGILFFIIHRGRRRLFLKIHMFLKMRATGMIRNVIMTESKFRDFQNYCCVKGFDLSYFSSEISGSEEEIEWYQFDLPKVIKIKRNGFWYQGVPYDVAVWQQQNWNSSFKQIVPEFFSTRNGERG